MADKRTLIAANWAIISLNSLYLYSMVWTRISYKYMAGPFRCAMMEIFASLLSTCIFVQINLLLFKIIGLIKFVLTQLIMFLTEANFEIILSDANKLTVILKCFKSLSI